MSVTQTGNWDCEKWDTNGDNDFVDSPYEHDDTRTHSDANELLTRDTDSNSTVNYTLAYDKNGNEKTSVTGSSTTTFVYDIENRLTSVTTSSSTTAYGYSADGRRLKRVSAGTTTYFGNDPVSPSRMGDTIEEYTSTGTKTATYLHGIGVDERWNRRFLRSDCWLQVEELRGLTCDRADHSDRGAGRNCGEVVGNRGWAGKDNAVDALGCQDFTDVSGKCFHSAVDRYDVHDCAAAAQSANSGSVAQPG